MPRCSNSQSRTHVPQHGRLCEKSQQTRAINIAKIHCFGRRICDVAMKIFCETK